MIPAISKVDVKYKQNLGLICPKCKGWCLHQGDVEIFERSEEDAKEGRHILVSKLVVIDKNLTGNPSSRRDGITIKFWCEGCSENEQLKLFIVQHKGSTFFKWGDFSPQAPRKAK